MRKHKSFGQATGGATEGRVEVPARLPFDYWLREPKTGARPRELIVLLHGYAESGARLLEKLSPALPDDALVLAPNATFPMAMRTQSGYTMVYTWYFYDVTAKEYVIDMKIALDHLAQGIEKLGFKDLPKRLIGFSQGGYLAPFAAARLGNVRQFVGIACEYLHEELAEQKLLPVPYRVDAIHGAKDDIVPLHEARDTHQSLLASGAQGSFTELPDTAHKIDAPVVSKLTQLLKTELKLQTPD